MVIKINDVEIAAYPLTFQVDIMDIDDVEGTLRMANGDVVRNRIAVKRKINLVFSGLYWDKVSSILQAIQAPFFEAYYPDPFSGKYETKTFYVSDRKAPIAICKENDIVWSGLSFSWVER